MKKQIVTGTIGILGILLTIMGTMYFTPEQLDNAYVCLATEEVGIFYGGISGSGLTAYPYLENRTKAERCYASNGDKSSWMQLYDYSAEFGISLDDLLKPKEIIPQTIGKKYLCSPEGCVENLLNITYVEPKEDSLPLYSCAVENSVKECPLGLSSGKGNRCYLSEILTVKTWDYCSSSWELI